MRGEGSEVQREESEHKVVRVFLRCRCCMRKYRSGLHTSHGTSRPAAALHFGPVCGGRDPVLTEDKEVAGAEPAQSAPLTPHTELFTSSWVA